MEKTTIYFGASKGKSFVSKIIKWFQWGDKHTHIFYILDEPFNNNPLVIEAWHEPILKGGGVRKGLFFEVENFHTLGTEWDIYSIEVTKKQKEDLEVYLHNKLGCKYDMKGILGFATRLQGTHSEEKLFCSELCMAGLQYIGINILRDTSPQETSPALFLKSPLLKLEKKVIK